MGHGLAMSTAASTNRKLCWCRRTREFPIAGMDVWASGFGVRISV